MFNLLQNPFIGVYELRKNLPKILSALKKEESLPVVVTHQGKPQAVVMAVEYYLELIEALGDLTEPGYLAELHKARKEILAGKGFSKEETYKKLGI